VTDRITFFPLFASRHALALRLSSHVNVGLPSEQMAFEDLVAFHSPSEGDSQLWSAEPLAGDDGLGAMFDPFLLSLEPLDPVAVEPLQPPVPQPTQPATALQPEIQSPPQQQSPPPAPTATAVASPSPGPRAARKRRATQPEDALSSTSPSMRAIKRRKSSAPESIDQATKKPKQRAGKRASEAKHSTQTKDPELELSPTLAAEGMSAYQKASWKTVRLTAVV
jgi:hypothetical protein